MTLLTLTITSTGKEQWFDSDRCSMTADIKKRVAKRKSENNLQ